MTQQQIDIIIFYVMPLISAALGLYALFLFLPQNKQAKNESVQHFKDNILSIYAKRPVRFSRRLPVINGNISSRALMNQSEKFFFQILSEALPQYCIFPQVSFNALITHASHVDNLSWKYAIRSKFNTKYVDFVLCSKSDFEVIAIAEYDGGGHRNHADMQRDSMLESVGYRVERFTQQDTIDTVRTRFS